MLAPDPSAAQEVSDLYRALLDAWNARDARAFASLFTDDGHIVGFDGSQADSAAELRTNRAIDIGSDVRSRQGQCGAPNCVSGTIEGDGVYLNRSRNSHG